LWLLSDRFARLYADPTTDCLTVDPSKKEPTGRLYVRLYVSKTIHNKHYISI